MAKNDSPVCQSHVITLTTKYIFKEYIDNTMDTKYLIYLIEESFRLNLVNEHKTIKYLNQIKNI